MSNEQNTARGGDSMERAAAFTARAFSGRASEQDSLALDLWLSEGENNHREYQQMLDAWSLVGGLADRVDELEETALRKRRPMVRWSLAASLVIGIAVALVNLLPEVHETTSTPYESFVTNTGEQQQVQLADGSHMTLNTNSRVLVDFNSQKRRLILERGEILLEVAKESERPFMVIAGSRAITVLGTTFNVHRSGLELNVGVVEGSVAVHRSEAPITSGDSLVDAADKEGQTLTGSASAYRLSAGVKANFSGVFASDSGKVHIEKIAQPNQYPYWHQGTVLFNNQSLSEVVRSLNRYTRKKILIEDARVMNLRISGMFQLGKVESTLYKLEKLLPIQVTTYPDRIVVTGL